MATELVTATDLTQALSQSLIDISMGREVKKSKLQKQIDISDAVNRRMQTHINVMKVMIEAKKNGIDFAASMKEIRDLMRESSVDIGSVTAVVDDVAAD